MRQFTAKVIPKAMCSLAMLVVVVACSGGDSSSPPGEGGTTPQSDGSQNTPGSSGETFGLDVPAFRDTVIRYEFDFTGQFATFSETILLRFADGTQTTDLIAVLNNEIDASKAENPEKWGRWRGEPSENSLELQYNDGSFKEVYASTESDPVQDNLVLDKCFKNLTVLSIPSLDLGGTGSSIRANEFCFQSDGIFSNESGSSTVTSALVASSLQDTAGFYEIDGQVIRLTYGNGSVKHFLFGIYSDSGGPQFGISLNRGLFQE